VRKEVKIGMFVCLGLVLVISIYLCTHKSMLVGSQTPQTPANVPASVVATALDANAPLTDLQPVAKTTVDLTKFEQSEPIKTQHFYIVHQGDVLSCISQKCYGTARKVNQIYEANRSIIKDKDLLNTGMKLIIPI
jgi:nucleoid-associated protein YgaU